MKRTLHSLEGNSQKLDGGSMYGNAPKALWERWSPADERNRIDLACRCLLVTEHAEDGTEKRILFEAGIGAFFSPKYRDRYGVVEEEHMLLARLADLGLRHGDIDVVVLSHLHFDHAGGLLSAWEEGVEPALLFDRATYVVSEPAWQRALQPHARDRASFIPVLQERLEASGRLERVAVGGQSAALGPDYRFHFSDGHTPGLMLTEIPGDRGPLVYAGDLVPGRPWVHRSITMGYDRFPELLLEEKARLIEDLAGRSGRLFFTHDPSCALARVTVDEQGRFGSTSDRAQVAGEVA